MEKKKTTTNKLKSENQGLKSHLIFLSFLEGSAVMVTEVASGKIVAPYFGTSLQIWAIILSTTLLGLALGYFIGGSLTRKNKDQKLVYYLLILSGLFIALMPIISQLLTQMFYQSSIISSALIVIPLFLIPPILLMGMVSPVIIFHLCDSKKNAGYFSGLIYAISTIGGILGTLIFGLFILPKFGVVRPLFFTGSLLILCAVFFLLRKNKLSAVALLFIPIIFLANSAFFSPNSSKLKVLYSSNGILGQLRVVDMDQYRFMLINNTVQAVYNPNNKKENIIHFMSALNKIFEADIIKGKKVLMFGLGGGLLANQLSNDFGLEVDVVEIDDRVKDLAKQYFDLADNVNVINKDARDFINKAEGKYDIIIFDTFLGEYIPSHLFTKESLVNVDKMLNPEGTIITDFHGYFDGPKGKGSKSIIKTLSSLGYKSLVSGTSKQNGIFRSLLFFSTKSTEAMQNLQKISQISHPNINVISYNESQLKDAIILTDKNLQLDLLMNEVGIEWREYIRKSMLQDFIKKGYILID